MPLSLQTRSETCRLNELNHIETRGRARHNDVTSPCRTVCVFAERLSKYNMGTWEHEQPSTGHTVTVQLPVQESVRRPQGVYLEGWVVLHHDLYQQQQRGG